MRRIVLMLVAGMLLLGGRAAANVSPEADIYQALMKKHGVKGPVTYDELRQSAAEFAGRVVEVRGTVVGTAQSGPNMTFILSLGDNASVTITATRPEIPGVESGNAVRVLARVPEGAVCLTSLDLVGVVPEWAIAPRDPKPKPAQAATSSAPAKEVATAPSRAKRGEEIPDRGAILAAYSRAVRYFNRKLSQRQADEIAWSVLKYSAHYKVDARLIMAVIAVESGFNPYATSRKGAMGLGQLMPATARGLGVGNAYNPHENIAGAVRLIRGHLEKFRGKQLWEQLALALACYNAGSGAVRKYGGIPPYRETQNYVRKVASLYRHFCGN